MATVVTLLLIPVLYVVFVKDLGLVRWDPASEHVEESAASRTRSAVLYRGERLRFCRRIVNIGAHKPPDDVGGFFTPVRASALGGGSVMLEQRRTSR